MRPADREFLKQVATSLELTSQSLARLAQAIQLRFGEVPMPGEQEPRRLRLVK